jgi:hypothetical protein
MFMVAMLCSFNAQATAPRITAQLFGEEQKADIVAYQSSDVKFQTALMVEIVNQAFKAAGKSPVVDVLPSRQLATYALFNKDVAGLIGVADDVAAKDRKQYEVVTFYLGTTDDSVLFLAHGSDLHKFFIEGMRKILKNGTYLQIVEKSDVKLPADYISRIKYLNPGWK